MRSLALLFLLAALALAGAGTAAAPKIVSLRIGDTVDVVGTPVLCVTATDDKTHLAGIGCLLANAKGPISGSYAGSIEANGTVQISRVQKGKFTKVFIRTLQSARATAAKRYRLGVGAFFAVAGTRLLCQITTGRRHDQAPTAACWLQARTGIQPSSYIIEVSGDIAGVVSVLKSGKVGPVVFAKHQPA